MYISMFPHVECLLRHQGFFSSEVYDSEETAKSAGYGRNVLLIY